MSNPLKQLGRYGQSVWLDYIRRSLITSGELTRHITEDGLRGVTSNPAIFGKAIAGSSDYESELAALDRRKDLDAKGTRPWPSATSRTRLTSSGLSMPRPTGAMAT